MAFFIGQGWEKKLKGETMSGRTGCQCLAEVVCDGCGKLLMLVPDNTLDNAEPFTAYCDDCLRRLGIGIAKTLIPAGQQKREGEEVKDG